MYRQVNNVAVLPRQKKKTTPINLFPRPSMKYCFVLFVFFLIIIFKKHFKHFFFRFFNIFYVTGSFCTLRQRLVIFFTCELVYLETSFCLKSLN